MDAAHIERMLAENWHVWLVTVTLIVAAVIDGLKLKVPNWITFPMILSGWVYSTVAFGWEGLAASLLGTAVGLGLLLPAYAIGGMGAGDVKLLAGVGAWMGAIITIYAFCALGPDWRSDRRGDGPLSPGLGEASRPVLDDRQRSHHDSRPGAAFGHRGRTQKVDAVAAVWNSHRAWIDCLLFLGRPADLGTHHSIRSATTAGDVPRRSAAGGSVSNWRSSVGRAEEIDRENCGRDLTSRDGRGPTVLARFCQLASRRRGAERLARYDGHTQHDGFGVLVALATDSEWVGFYQVNRCCGPILATRDGGVVTPRHSTVAR